MIIFFKGLINNYDFGEVSYSEESEEEEDQNIIKSENEEDSDNEDVKRNKKHKKQQNNKKDENLDDLLKEFGSNLKIFKLIIS